jgi:hypothetical protein
VVTATNSLSGKAFYGDIRKAFEESILPREVSVGVKLLRISMDLTDLGREAWTEPLDSDSDPGREFDEQLMDLEVEYLEVERKVLLLTGVEAQAYAIECARLRTQFREIGYNSAGFEEESEEESEDEDSAPRHECGEEECLGEILVRKVSGTHGDTTLGVPGDVG